MLGFLEPVRARFNGLVSDMTPRDRALLLGLLLSLYAGLIVGGFWLSQSILGDLRSRVATREAAMVRLEEMEAGLVRNSAKVEEIEDLLRNNATQDLPSFVEKAAAKLGLGANLKAVRAKGATTEGNLEERSYTIELERVTLAQMTDLLFELETAGFPLRIRTTRLKTSGPPGTRVLTANFEVSAYKLVESAKATEGI